MIKRKEEEIKMSIGENKYANEIGYTDIRPNEIIKVHTPRKLTIRSMNAEAIHTADDLGWETGGFCATATNQYAQRWKITSNPEGHVVEIRLHKDGCWRSKHGQRYKLAAHPVKFYDYNF